MKAPAGLIASGWAGFTAMLVAGLLLMFGLP